MASYGDTLDYLFQKLPMYQRVGPMAFKKDLGNIRKLLAALEMPQDSFQSIHIAGTNGKGSVAHMLSAILQSAGYKTGLYTSPHLKDFRERIRVDGERITEDYVVQFVEANKPAFEEIEPSFFEMSVAMAFWYFKELSVDFAVVETGLGGRFDSTNILMPILSIITNIGYDHEQFLGDTLQDIAFEKAGIIKAGVPLVIGQTDSSTYPVFKEKVIEEKTSMHLADKALKITRFEHTELGMEMDIETSGKKPFLDKLWVDVQGEYQMPNILTAIRAAKVLQRAGFKLEEKHVRAGLGAIREMTGLAGRWDIHGKDPLIIADTAHNVQGMRLAMSQLRNTPHEKLHLVIGMVNDKDPARLLEMLPTKGAYYFCSADMPRSMNAEVLQKAASGFGLSGKSYSSVNKAVMAAKKTAKKADVIYIGGSTFVVAEI